MNNLDEYQKEAVLSNTNTLLIAGAGSGKTYTIVNKIKYLIDNNIYLPKEILVLSFTNKSVSDLKNKIEYNCDISTFHKLAINILNDYHITYNIVSTDYLSYITNEYFLSLDNPEDILIYFHEYNYQHFLNSYKYQELIKLITTIISIYKTNNNTKDDFIKLFKTNSFLSKYCYIIKNIYEKELLSSNSMDFDDLIINATKIINKPYKYKYIIVDEFQDTSQIRFNLINKLRILNNATLFCVGDDYQSIYHFSGCDLNIFLNFTKYVNNSKVINLRYTYRNSQELINICSKFIMKNKYQINKNLISNKHTNNPIKIIYYINPKKAFKKLYNSLNNPLVLGRNNYDINQFTSDSVNYMTIHSSKGLEADNVIIINLINNKYGFPNQIINNQLLEELHPTTKEILHAEERRLFYVALTRTKNNVYLLVPFFNKSIFVKEIKKYY